MIEKAIATVSRYNGLQISVEVKAGDKWHYLRLGIHDGVDLVYSHATAGELNDIIKSKAWESAQDPVRLAASSRMTGNFTTLFDTREWFDG